MTESWAERQRRIEREQRHAEANRNISSLNNQIAVYETARSSVVAAKNKCSSEKGEWEENSARLSAKEILKKDIFEGEMSQKLEEYLADGIKENQDGINVSQSLLSTLDDQITMINNKIEQLNSDISYWRSQLYW